MLTSALRKKAMKSVSVRWPMHHWIQITSYRPASGVKSCQGGRKRKARGECALAPHETWKTIHLAPGLDPDHIVPAGFRREVLPGRELERERANVSVSFPLL